jgi:hypothetical protein
MFKFSVYTILLMFVLLVGGANIANAQSGDVYFGMGTATDKATGASVDTFGDGTLLPTPKMSGVFGRFGADFMFRPTLGAGFDYSFRFNQGSYAGLNYRPKFYDFNAIWMPIANSKKVVPEFQAGAGGATLSFYLPQQCISGIACSSSTYLVSSTHFQTHLSAGVRIYAKGGIYIRPQFDVHYVRNFFQFGSNWVPEYSVAVGYTFGRR